jgi:hypothetical protein
VRLRQTLDFSRILPISINACLPLVTVPITMSMGTLVTPVNDGSGLHSYTVKKCERSDFSWFLRQQLQECRKGKIVLALACKAQEAGQRNQ